MPDFTLSYSARDLSVANFTLTRVLGGMVWTDELKDQSHPHYDEVFGSGFIYTSDEDVEDENFRGYKLYQSKKDPTTKFYFPTENHHAIVPQTAKFLKISKTEPWTHKCTGCDQDHTTDTHDYIIYSLPDLKVVSGSDISLKTKIELDISSPDEHGNLYFHGIYYNKLRVMT